MEHLFSIETPRLILSELEEGDKTSVFELFSNSTVLEFYDLKAFVSLEEAEVLIEKMHLKWKTRIGFRYAIRLKQNRTMLGTCGVNSIKQVDNDFAVVIGYELHPKAWGIGYMQEALTGIIQYLKQERLFGNKIKYIWAEIFERNIKSQQVVNKLGFELIGKTVNHTNNTVSDNLLKFELKLY
ncbi:GNAT family N-acetyltransferase [Acinetobacter nosocomialis]|uniref:GNAT family N-acetyltransferase n=1 Tax=Acinetobacter nosocomialis TaxID=106654 RepID=UPI00124FADFB|nr:GNAT family N-acetyltransferase [Acinetobacter nosocomialis]MCU4552119.1 GNAT family N-acetyltransferase [Acinetobacter nosocomialis]MDH2590634.1 GNAT family N-acetyltransferase [Acinetobacter nosocomialis]MDO7229823.1 GNAT family N-acetyltransferase [Acinetobacter nosocomialis]MDP7773772.1 GNAT family N-acetyltransferase [Acinetobacter nosocomialis]